MLHDRSSQLTTLRAQLAAHALELAAIKLQFVLKANFNPGQLRDELGRWVDEGGGDDATGRVHLAQTDGQHRYSVDLNEEEGLGGHTKRDHVGKSDDYLLGFVRAARYRGPLFTISRVREGSFASFESPTTSSIALSKRIRKLLTSLPAENWSAHS